MCDVSRARRTWLRLALLTVAAGAMTVHVLAQPDQPRAAAPDPGGVRNLDARVGLRGLHVFVPREAQQAEVNDLRSVMPDLRAEFDQATGATRSLWNAGGYLTPADGRAPRAVAEDFVAARATLLGLSDADVVDVELTDSLHSRLTGVTHLYYRQRLGGIPVYNAQLQFNITKDGRILSINNSFLPSLTASVPTLRPAMDAASAVAFVAEHLGVDGVSPEVRASSPGERQDTSLAAPELSAEPIGAQLMLLPIQRGEARLVWNLQVWTLDGQHAFDFTVDAETGHIWTRIDWAAADQYRVYPRPVQSPGHATPVGTRALVSAPADATASPYGWHDTNGVAGAEFTTTEGNNVSAYADVDADNLPDTGSPPDCGASIECDFSIFLTLSPAFYKPAAVTNLFYWTNLVHDIQYRYGFDEAAGNFQVNTYGRGGAGADSVRAEAQDGNGINNANFATPPDGQQPRMQMYVWSHTSPYRDGDLDSGIIVHEYGHGISNRLVGGPSNVSCLGNAQQPGEGISDWLALVYTARSTDSASLARGIGSNVTGEPASGTGIRGLPYTIDNSVNPWTYASITSMSGPHAVGSVWAQGMWEVYWALVNAYGFSPDLHNATGGAGNQRAMLYHNEGLKFTSCSPGFTQVRDGIIQAAQLINGGADVCRLWFAFAGWGLGANAVNPSPSSTSGVVNGFNVPAACGGTANPGMSINDVAVVEGDSGPTTATFTVSLSHPSLGDSQVSYATAQGTATVPVFIFTAAEATDIPPSGAASPYPVTLNVSGVQGEITSLAVRINGLSHSESRDLDLLLVGPGGQASMFMSDLGQGIVNNVTLTFRDGAPDPPLELVSGTYAPTNRDDGLSDAMPAPAPAGDFGTALSVFNGSDPNGTWRLYVFDDGSGWSGELDGFSLLITPTIGPDFVHATGQVFFPAGTTSQTVSVAVNGDTIIEQDQTFFVNLSNPINATLVDAQGMATILNDDGLPTTVDDNYTTAFNTPLAVGAPGVLANDSSNGGGALSAQLLTNASHGVVSVNANGSFSYTPDGGFVGADAFTYRAVNGIGPGTVAQATIVVQDATTVQAPYNLRVDSVVGTTVTLRWDVPSIGPRPAGFVLEGGVGPGDVLASLPTGSDAPVFTFTAPTGSYFIRMHGVLGTDRSPASNEVPLHVNVPVAPSAPAGLTGLVDGSALSLAWTNTFAGGPPSGLVLDVSGSIVTSIPIGLSERFSFAGVPAGTYTLSLRATNAGGSSPNSNAVALTFPTACSGAPQPPANFVGFRIGRTVHVVWDAPTSGPAATGYVLRVSGAYAGSIPTAGRSVSGTVGPGTYHLSVAATNACGTSVATPEQTVTVPSP